MKKLIITGNGLDIAHGLKTSFNDFIEHSELYAEKYSVLKNEDDCWNSVEKHFKEIVTDKLDEIGCEVNVDEIVEGIIDAYGTDESGEVLYYDYRSDAFKEEIEIISEMVLLLIGFETDFLYYLRELYYDEKVLNDFQPMPVLQSEFDSAIRVVNFNYTNVVELLYGFQNVEHIHGNINDKIVIGCDTFERIQNTGIHADYPSSKMTGRPKEVLAERLRYYEYDMENNLVERTSIKRFFDNVVRRAQNNEEELYKWLKMKSKDFLETRKAIIESLSIEEFDEVHIIGHSLGEVDWNVFDIIKAKKIICYYHDEEDYKKKKTYIKQKGWNMTLKPDKEILC